jgi:hypothetical protein
VRLEDLLLREPRTSRSALDEITIDPSDPALFLLSGGWATSRSTTRWASTTWPPASRR